MIKKNHPQKKDWKGSSERSNNFTIKLICWIALHTGRGIARFFLYPITLYFLSTSPSIVKVSKNYFFRVKQSSVSVFTVFRHIHHFAATILDRVFFLTDQFERFEIKIHGKEIVDKFIKNNQGCILLGTHHGSFEVLRALGNKETNIDLKILMYREHNQMITRILDELNPDISRNVINLSDADSLMQMQDALNKGSIIGMLGDRVANNERMTHCKLLGSDVEFPASPVLLASIMKVPVVLFYGLYQGDNRYDVYFELLSESISIERQHREKEIADWSQKIAARLEYYIKLSPYNWFNFYDYWHDEND